MPDRYRVAIVGSGPAGLSAAAHAAVLGMSHILIEKTDHLSDTIYKYQKGKYVMATPVKLELRSDLDFEEGIREDILRTWDEQIEANKVNVKLNAEVTEISGEAGNFTIKLKDGSTIEAEAVVFGIGTQGNPNLLGVPGSDTDAVTYQLDDPEQHKDKHITVIGSGDAGIENALGLATEVVLQNTVTILNRRDTFARAKKGNVDALTDAENEGLISVKRETSPAEVKDGEIVLKTRNGEETIPCDMVIARLGSKPPRAFVEGCGIEFTSEDPNSFPKLTPAFETTKPGIYVIGALAGYPLIKHCMNQGYDVIEFLNGNTDLKPADEPILEEKFAPLPGNKPVDYWLELFNENIGILNSLSPLQMRELMLESDVHSYKRGEMIFERNAEGSSMFAIAQGSVAVEIVPDEPSITVPIEEGSIFGEVGLISGRKRGSTIRAAEDTICVEFSRNAALKLIATNPAVGDAVNRISIERQLLQMFGSGLTPGDIKDLVDKAEVIDARAGDVIVEEDGEDKDVFVVRRGSMMVEKDLGGKPVFLSYLPAGSYFGEMAVIDGSSRTATVKAAIKSEVVKLPGDEFLKVLDAKPQLREKALAEMAGRRATNEFIESRKDSFGSAVDMYSETAQFLINEGIGDATDVLLIDEKLCVGCDNCEKACADSHDGLSRLNREAGTTYAHLHVPTSCRHCEHPHCMADCPPNAIKRGPDGEVFIDETCIGCGNCQRNCPYGVIRMDAKPPKKPGILSWIFFGRGTGPGEAPLSVRKKHIDDIEAETGKKPGKFAIKCDMCKGIEGGPACVRACPTGAAIRVSPERFLSITRFAEETD